MKRRWILKGFTLIELLIVVAIIAILAAIAVPNFLEAQVRAKVSRVLTDQRTCVTALESYAVDHNHYPPAYGTFYIEERWSPLTTPVAYMTSIPTDVFGDPVQISDWRVTDADGYGMLKTFDFLVAYPGIWETDNFFPALDIVAKRRIKYYFTSQGPDRHGDTLFSSSSAPALEEVMDFFYESTNGTMSSGDIFKMGP